MCEQTMSACCPYFGLELKKVGRSFRAEKGNKGEYRLSRIAVIDTETTWSDQVMSIGAVKAVEIGDGTRVSAYRGSENNDAFASEIAFSAFASFNLNAVKSWSFFN